MDRKMIKHILQITGVAVFVLALTLMPASAVMVGAQSLLSTPAVRGYIDHDYGTAVKVEPSADGAESKLWFNDGFWWGILFNPGTVKYEIYRLEWNTQTWNTTGIAVDSRQEITSVNGVPTPSGTIDTRADVLWDKTANKLYIASHIKVDNPSRTSNADNWGRLYRYSYSAGSKTYTLDDGFPVDVNKDKTETLVLDRDTSNRLWVTYISRVPTSDPSDVEPYKVYVNATVTAGNDQVWGTPIELDIANPGAIVGRYDLVTLVAFGNNIGLMWSNSLDGKFYFAQHANSSAPGSGWNVQTVTVPGYNLLANNHLKMVANSAGQVFIALKTDHELAPETLVGILARDTNGSFSYTEFSKAGSLDTRPTLVLNESDNRLHLFVTSQESGGVICTASVVITSPLSNMAFPGNDCKSNVTGSAEHFISDAQFNKLDNPTTSKRNVTNASGIVVLATDDTNGHRYLHNVINPSSLPLPIKLYLPIIKR